MAGKQPTPAGLSESIPRAAGQTRSPAPPRTPAKRREVPRQSERRTATREARWNCASRQCTRKSSESTLAAQELRMIPLERLSAARACGNDVQKTNLAANCPLSLRLQIGQDGPVGQFFSAISSKVRAASDGARRPCSHSWSVRTDTPSNSANRGTITVPMTRTETTPTRASSSG